MFGGGIVDDMPGLVPPHSLQKHARQKMHRRR